LTISQMAPILPYLLLLLMLIIRTKWLMGTRQDQAMSAILLSPMNHETMPHAAPASSAPVRYYRFKPWNIGRGVVWSVFALLLIIAPLVLTSSLALTMLSQMGYGIIICLSYNILLGQGGMLSFGHAVYTGLGSFLAIHALNRSADGGVPIPVW